MTKKDKFKSVIASAREARGIILPSDDFADRTYKKAIASLHGEHMIVPRGLYTFRVLVPVLCLLVCFLYVTEIYIEKEKTIYLMELLVADVSSLVI